VTQETADVVALFQQPAGTPFEIKARDGDLARNPSPTTAIAHI
jgi:hypothetical protein